jgi:integrase
MAERINFTKAVLDAVELPDAGKRIVLLDAKAPSLQLRVTANGAKTFCVFRRVRGGGSPERVTLGRYPTISIEQARRRAAEVAAAMESGTNPAELLRAQKGELTFSDLFKDYLDRHAKPRKRTWEGDKQRYQQYLAKPLGGKKLSAISRQTIALLHSDITKSGHSTVANRVLALVSSIYGRGMEWGLVESNPTRGIRRNREQSRDRFLQSEELPRFFSALADEPNKTVRDYFLLSLLTGARRANVLEMRWTDVSLDEAIWRIQMTKNGTPQNVPLLPEAVEILAERKAVNDQDKENRSVFVFPSYSKSGHLTEPKKGWQRIFDRDELRQLIRLIHESGGVFDVVEETDGDAETLTNALVRARALAAKHDIDTAGTRIPDLRIHDLRRTLGSWQAKTGASLAIIGKSLNHKNHATTAIYARLDIDPVRASMERATAAMLTAAGVKKPAEVKPIKRRTRKGI